MTATQLIVSILIGIGLILSGWLSLPTCLVDQAAQLEQGDAYRTTCENAWSLDCNATDPADALSSLCPFCSPVALTEPDSFHHPTHQLSSLLAPAAPPLAAPPRVLRPPLA